MVHRKALTKKQFDTSFKEDQDGRGACFVHIDTSIRFRKVPKAIYPMGVTPKEIEQIQRMGFQGDTEGFAAVVGERTSEIESFYITETPLTIGQAKAIAGRNAPISKYAEETTEFDVAHLKFEWVEKNLIVEQFDLPTKDELEAAYRGTTARQLFPWGNALMPRPELQRWMKTNFESTQKLPANKFGLVGLCCGSWSKSLFDFSQTQFAKQKNVNDKRALKLPVPWPWQTSEWVYCMNGVHASELELWPEKRCPVRLIVRA